MSVWNLVCLYTTIPCVQTMHTQKIPPDSRQRYCPLSYIRLWTTDHQKSDPP